MYIVNKKQGSKEWLDWRRQGITATDAVVILGRSPYKTPWRLWMEKTGRLAPEDLSNNPHVQRGKRMEDEARRMFEERHGTMLLPICAEADEDPVFRASMDGLTDDEEAVPVELKCPSDKVFEEVAEHGIASETARMYYVQLQHQILVCGSQAGFLVFYREVNGEAEIKEIKAKRDQAVIDEILEKGRRFQEMIETGKEPEKDPERDLYVPDPSRQADWLDLGRRRYRMDRELARLEDRAKEIKKALKENEAEFLALMEEAGGGFMHAEYGGVKITRYVAKGSVDYTKLLKHELPELDPAVLDGYRRKATERVRISVSREANTATDAQPRFRVIEGGEANAEEKVAAFAW